MFNLMVLDGQLWKLNTTTGETWLFNTLHRGWIPIETKEVK